MRNLKFDAPAYKEFEEWLQTNPKIAQRIKALIQNILSDPFKGLGKPEPLKHDWQGYWSRRIDDNHRLIYKVTEETVIIASCKFHYSKTRR